MAITNELGFNVITPVVISEKQKSKAPLYQQSWYSDDLGTGTYTVTLTHISGVNVNLDLIKVYPSPTPGGADW